MTNNKLFFRILALPVIFVWSTAFLLLASPAIFLVSIVSLLLLMYNIYVSYKDGNSKASYIKNYFFLEIDNVFISNLLGTTIFLWMPFYLCYLYLKNENVFNVFKPLSKTIDGTCANRDKIKFLNDSIDLEIKMASNYEIAYEKFYKK